MRAVVMVVMVVMVLRKSRRRKEHDHGKQQSFFHVQIIATKLATSRLLRANFWVRRIATNTLRSAARVLIRRPNASGKESIVYRHYAQPRRKLVMRRNSPSRPPWDRAWAGCGKRRKA